MTSFSFFGKKKSPIDCYLLSLNFSITAHICQKEPSPKANSKRQQALWQKVPSGTMETVALQHVCNLVRQSSSVIENQAMTFLPFLTNSFRISCFMSHLSPQTSTLAKGKKNIIFLLFELSGVIDS